MLRVRNLLLLIILSSFSLSAEPLVTVADMQKYATDAIGRVCILDTTKDENPRIWTYYSGEKTESLKCSDNIANMVVVSRRMLGYELGKAVKIDHKYISSGYDELGQKYLYFGRDALFGRFLQLALLLKDTYKDPFDCRKEGTALIPEYKNKFVFIAKVKTGDIGQLQRYFLKHAVVPLTEKPLLLLDVVDDSACTLLTKSERAFLDVYFTWENITQNTDAQEFIEKRREKMRSFESDVIVAGPNYRENIRQGTLRMLEGICGDFEFKRFAPRLVLLIGGLMLLKHREKIFEYLRMFSPVDKTLDFLGIDLGVEKKDKVLEKLRVIGEILLLQLRGQRPLIEAQQRGLNMQADAVGEQAVVASVAADQLEAVLRAD